MFPGVLTLTAIDPTGRPWCRGIKVRIARRGTEDMNHLGRHRWVVERTTSWVLRFKRLGIRYDYTEATLLPLLLLAVDLINLRRLRQTTEL